MGREADSDDDCGGGIGGGEPAKESVFDQGRPDITKPSKPPAKTEAQIKAENKVFAETKAKAEAGDASAQSKPWMKIIRIRRGLK